MRAQAATEYLMGYAFYIVVIVVVIAALSYFGVLGVKHIQDSCVFSGGITCIDRPAITGSAIGFAVKNTHYDRVTITGISSDVCSGEAYVAVEDSAYTPPPVDFRRDNIAKINMSCPEIEETIKTDVVISYINPDSGLENKASGEIQGTVK